MEKFCGKVGYCFTEETAPSVYQDGEPIERTYRGDILKNSSKWVSAPQVNDNLRLANRISIVADAYANQNFSAIKYVEYRGVLWKVTDIEVQRPRLILTLGGEYNG